MEEQDEITSWNFFVGFKVYDVHHGDLGEVVDVDDATMNVLFVIEKEGGRTAASCSRRVYTGY